MGWLLAILLFYKKQEGWLMEKDIQHKYADENEEQFLWRLGQAKDSGTLDMDWNGIAEIINKECRDDISDYRSEAAYRKPYQQAKRFYEAGVFNELTGDTYIQDIHNAKRELERLKIQFRDERNAWQKQNYTDARVEDKLNKLETNLQTLGKINFEIHDNVSINSDNDILVILSDLHIGQCFSSVFGKYNSDIAKKRLHQLLIEIINIKKLYNSENCYISLQGDLISGNIHKSIQVSNRENVIEQIKVAVELISSFCYELTKYFQKVFMSSVSGNHSRIDRKDDAIHDERMDDIVSWAVDLSLNHIDNFHVLKRNIDNGIADILIRGKTYIAVHGDYDNFTKSGVSNLCMSLGFLPYAVTFGHLHVCSIDEVNGVKMIRGGSLAGCGDSYTIEKRLTGKPSQMICVCNDKGVRAYYPIELN